ncbi:hypothetical protein ACFYQ5_11445 [Streptomyces sp. NPDC005794]
MTGSGVAGCGADDEGTDVHLGGLVDGDPMAAPTDEAGTVSAAG